MTSPRRRHLGRPARRGSRTVWLLLGSCAILAVSILLLMPAEKTIGGVIRIVYLHGALSRAGMIGFLAAGAAGGAYLIWARPAMARWSRALAISGWLFWTAHFVVSMPATRMTWGPWIAWGEPRVTMSLQIIAAGLAVLVVSWLVDHTAFTAAANLLMGGAVLVLAERTGVLRHPLDPIGSSPSAQLRLVYLLLLIPVVSAMLLTAWQLATHVSAGPQLAPDKAPSGRVEE